MSWDTLPKRFYYPMQDRILEQQFSSVGYDGDEVRPRQGVVVSLQTDGTTAMFVWVESCHGVSPSVGATHSHVGLLFTDGLQMADGYPLLEDFVGNASPLQVADGYPLLEDFVGNASSLQVADGYPLLRDCMWNASPLQYCSRSIEDGQRVNADHSPGVPV